METIAFASKPYFSLISSKVPDFELYDKLKMRFFENPVEIKNEINTEVQSEVEQQ